MRIVLIVSFVSSLLRVCGEARVESSIVAEPPVVEASAVAVAPPPVTIEGAPGVAPLGDAQLQVVADGPTREVRVYARRHGRPLPASAFQVQRTTVWLPEGPRVLVLHPAGDYYVATAPFPILATARVEVEADLIADPAPPAHLVVGGFAPFSAVAVVSAPSVVVAAPSPPAFGVRADVEVIAPRVRVREPHVAIFVPPPPSIVVVPPRPPSISIGFGVPSTTVIVEGHHHGHAYGHFGGHGHGRGHGHH